jgi:hypothetical protein
MIGDYYEPQPKQQGALLIPCGQKTRRGPTPPEQSRFLFLINVSVSAAIN